MGTKSRKSNEHMFSVELKAREYLKRVAVSDVEADSVLVEGFLGRLRSIDFTEGIMLEINGTNGSLRMDLSETELKTLLPQKSHRLRNSKDSVLKGAKRR